LPTLNERENELITILEKRNEWTGEEFLALSKLRAKRGQSDQDFEVVQKYFAELQKDAKHKGIDLPNGFISFFNNHDFLARFRTGDLSFLTLEGLNIFPDNPNYFITPFLGDSQGFEWWYLVINKNSEYCILYNTYHWEEKGEFLSDGEPRPQYFICADSFEEFIARLSADIVRFEEKNPTRLEFKFPKTISLSK
jgi:hypothetical protein